MATKYLTAEALRSLLSYCPDTGVFRHLAATSNAIKAGAVAGYSTDQGYVQIMVDGHRQKAHRLAWLYMTGEWPTGEIDHINGMRGDNRWANLRDITPSENQHNRRARRKSASGLLGVAKSGTTGKPWRAQIKPPGERVRYLGLFATAEEAHAAYLEAKRKLHPTSPSVQIVNSK